MPQDEDKLNKKEEEYMKTLGEFGQVMVTDEKELKKIAKKLKKIYGLADPPVVGP